MSCGLAQQGAAVAAPSPHIFAHAPRRLGGPADRETDLSCRAQGRTDHPTARKFDTKRTIRSGGHPRSASRRQIISVGNCPVPDVNRVRDVRDGSRSYGDGGKGLAPLSLCEIDGGALCVPKTLPELMT